MTAGAGRGGGGYGLLLLLTLMNVINFVDRQLLSSFANYIVPELKLTNTEFGLLTGLVFMVFYAVAGLVMGALADMVHRPRLIGAAMLVWSGLTAASGLARGFVSMAIPRVFISVGESALTPAALSLLADRFPVERRGFAAGFFYMGVPLGMGASLLVAGLLGPVIGWRNCFIALGAAGVLFSLSALAVKETRRGARAHAKSPRMGELFGVFRRTVAGSRPLQMTIAGAALAHFLLGAGAFDQLWLVRERGFDRAEIATICGLAAVFAGGAGNLFGGLVSDRVVQATGQSRTMFMVWLLIALLPLNFAYRLAPAGGALFWIGLAVNYFQLGTIYGPTVSTVQEHCPPQVRSTVVAVLVMANNLSAAVGITVGGVLVDRLIAAGVRSPYTWTLTSFIAALGLAIVCFWLAARTSAPAEAATMTAA